MSKLFKRETGFSLPIFDLKNGLKLEKPVVVLPEDKYDEMLEDMEDLKAALKAEEEYIQEGGKLFSDYDKSRSKHNKKIK